MIRLTRNRAAISRAFLGKPRLKKALALLDAYEAGLGKPQFTAKNSYWKAAKDQLKAETHGKCAYCEAPTDTVAHGDVEHFRPKSLYWWLAYCYDNFLFACQICNQTYKGDAFPIHASKPLRPAPRLPLQLPVDLDARAVLAEQLAPSPRPGHGDAAWDRFLHNLQREKAALIDPYLTDPEPLFQWIADPVQKEVALAPRRSRGPSRQAFEAVEQFLGLNREELRRLRWKTYHGLLTFKELLSQGRLPPAQRRKVQEHLRQMMQPDWQFAGMTRYFVRVRWKLKLD